MFLTTINLSKQVATLTYYNDWLSKELNNKKEDFKELEKKYYLLKQGKEKDNRRTKSTKASV